MSESMIMFEDIPLRVEYTTEPYQASSMDGPEIQQSVEIDRAWLPNGSDILDYLNADAVLYLERILIKHLED